MYFYRWSLLTDVELFIDISRAPQHSYHSFDYSEHSRTQGGGRTSLLPRSLFTFSLILIEIGQTLDKNDLRLQLSTLLMVLYAPPPRWQSPCPPRSNPGPPLLPLSPNIPSYHLIKKSSTLACLFAKWYMYLCCINIKLSKKYKVLFRCQNYVKISIIKTKTK